MFNWGEILPFIFYGIVGMILLYLMVKGYYKTKTKLFMRTSEITEKKYKDKLAISHNLEDVSPADSKEAFKQACILQYRWALQTRTMFKSSIRYFSLSIKNHEVEISNSRKGLHSSEETLKELESYFGMEYGDSESEQGGEPMKIDTGADPEDGGTPLHVASKNSQPSVIKMLLDAGAEVNARDNDGNTPLHKAVSNPEPSVVKVLIDAGAEVNAREKDGWTPLHWAAAKNSEPSVVKALLDAGAEVNARDRLGKTPLHEVAMNKDPNPSIVKALIDAGAEVNARTRDGLGMTPLHQVAWIGNPEPSVVKVLLDAGADMSIKDPVGKTPFDYAEENEALQGTDAYWRLNEARYK